MVVNMMSIISSASTLPWYYEDVEFVVENGYMSYDSFGEFFPDAYITRAEFATVLNRVTGAKKTTSATFKDVSPDAWYATDMDVAKTAGLLSGDAQGNANPENYITREEMAVMIDRAFPMIGSGASFADESSISDWALEKVSSVAFNGYINGYEDGSFKPKDFITRAEVAAVIHRIATARHDTVTDIEDGNFEENVIVAMSDIKISDTVIGKTLYVTPAVTGSEIVLDNVTADTVSVSASDRVRIEVVDSKINNLILSGKNQPIVLLEGETSIKNCYVKKDTMLLCLDNEQMPIDNIEAVANFSAIGNIGTLNLKSQCTVEIQGDVALLNIDAQVGEPSISINGEIAKVNSKSDFEVNGQSYKQGTLANKISYSESSNIKYSYSAMINLDDESIASIIGTSTSKDMPDGIITDITVADGTMCGFDEAYSPGKTDYKIYVPSGAESLPLDIKYTSGYDLIYKDEVVALGDEISVKELVQGENKIELLVMKDTVIYGVYSINLVRSTALSPAEITTLNDKIQTKSLVIGDLSSSMFLADESLISKYNDELYLAKTTKGNLSQDEIQEIILNTNESIALLKSIKLYSAGNVYKDISVTGTTVTANIDYTLSSVDLAPIPFYLGEKCIIGGNEYSESTRYTVSGLEPGVEKTIEVRVKSKNGENETVYTVKLTRDMKYPVNQTITVPTAGVHPVSITYKTTEARPLLSSASTADANACRKIVIGVNDATEYYYLNPCTDGNVHTIVMDLNLNSGENNIGFKTVLNGLTDVGLNITDASLYTSGKIKYEAESFETGSSYVLASDNTYTMMTKGQSNKGSMNTSFTVNVYEAGNYRITVKGAHNANNVLQVYLNNASEAAAATANANLFTPNWDSSGMDNRLIKSAYHKTVTFDVELTKGINEIRFESLDENYKRTMVIDYFEIEKVD